MLKSYIILERNGLVNGQRLSVYYEDENNEEWINKESHNKRSEDINKEKRGDIRLLDRWAGSWV